MKPPDWMAEVTDVSEDEARGLLDGDAALGRSLADATEPLDPEVEALVARARPVPARWDARWWLGPVLVGAVALALVSLRPAPPAPPARHAIEGRPLVAGVPAVADPGYRATGTGTWEVARDALGVLATQTSGVLTWEVDPVPEGQRFRVVVDDVLVEVVGTRFTVGSDPVPWVEVAAGRVLVHHRGVTALLVAGDRWERPARPSAPTPVPAPPPPPVPADGRELAELLGRVESGERTAAVRDALRAWATSSANPALAGEAEVAALEVDAALLDPDLAAQAIDAWLGTHRDDPHRVSLLELRADTLAAGDGGCEDALPAYLAVTAEARGEALARAWVRVGSCARKLGRPDQARQAFDAAMAAGLDGPLLDEVRRETAPQP